MSESPGSIQGWELVVVDRGAPRCFPLPNQTAALVGRTADCSIRLEDSSVSRRHARLHLDDLEVEDLNSRNGTWLLPGAAGGEPDLRSELLASLTERLEPGSPARFAPRQVIRFGNVLGFLQSHRVEPILTLPAPPAPEVPSKIVVADPEMRRAYQVAERAAQSSLPVLVMGETGVGKDVLAAHIHATSPRRAEAFIRVNCGALTPSLLESELFGHQRGAFTGAAESKPGLIELAHRGTAFLDELGELPLATQVKLLHVLETGEVTRLGETRARRIDVRFVAATNRNLARDVKAGSFRKDLYFRINAISIVLAPLRERPHDIAPLAAHFLRRFCEQNQLPIPDLAAETLALLAHHAWPGNVRELKNAIERAVVMCGAGPLLPQHLPDRTSLPSSLPPHTFEDAELPTRVVSREQTITAQPRSAGLGHAEIQAALAACGGNQTRAAELLGISRRTLINRLERLQMPRPRKSGQGDGA